MIADIMVWPGIDLAVVYDNDLATKKPIEGSWHKVIISTDAIRLTKLFSVNPEAFFPTLFETDEALVVDPP